MRYIFLVLAVVSMRISEAQQLGLRSLIVDTSVIARGKNNGPLLNADDAFGTSVANIGDLDNDGVEDIAVGAIFDDDGGLSTNNKGAIYICFMNSNKTVKSRARIGATTQGMGSTIGNLDYFGSSVSGIGDLNSDGVEDIVVGSYADDASGFTNCGSVYIIFLNTNGTVSSSTRIIRGSNGCPATVKAQSWFGYSVANLGDVDGDGIIDIGVGGPGYQGDFSAGTYHGAYWTLFMNTNGTAKSGTMIAEGINWNGDIDASDYFGWAIAAAGDLNNDGISEVMVGAPGDDDYLSNHGAYYLLYLNAQGGVSGYKKYTQPLVNKTRLYNTPSVFGLDCMVKDINLDGQPEFIFGCNTGNSFIVAYTDEEENIVSAVRFGDNLHSKFSLSGFGVTAMTAFNDLDGDQKIDMVFGAPIYDAPGYTNSGAVVFMDIDTVYNEIQIGDVYDYDTYGESSNTVGSLDQSDWFGFSVADIGDVNGDGNRDIAIGAQKDDDGASAAGAIYILFLDSLQHRIGGQKISSTAGGFGTGLDLGDNFGTSICGPGDLDGDNIPDILVGANLDDDGVGNAGAVWILYLNSNGTVKSKAKISRTSGSFTGTPVNSFGTSIASIGDLDNDGINDFAVGESRSNDGGTDRGAVWILFMNANETVKSHQKISDTQGNFTETFSGTSIYFGVSVCAAGDLNNDQKEDIIVGASGMDNTGAVYILYLNTNGTVSSYKKINNSASNFPETLTSADDFGFSVALLDDLDGDGFQEIAIGQPLYDDETFNVAGCIWIAYPDSAGTILDVKQISATKGLMYANLYASNLFGFSLGTYRDTDGLQYLFSGARGYDETGTDDGAAFKMGLTSAKSSLFAKNTEKYYVLKRKLDANYYRPKKGAFHFAYNEEYNDTDGKLALTIYKVGTNQPVYTPTNLNVVYGQNRISINPKMLPPGFYVLEVKNEKNESRYFEFEKQW